MRIAMNLALFAGLLLTFGASPQDKTGTIKGKVTHYTVKKYPTLVYIDEIPGREFPAPEQHAVMDQKGKVFIPRLLPVLKGTTVDFSNSDDFEHNVFSPDGKGYNLGNWGKGITRSHVFSETGSFVQLCKLHPEMVAYVVVVKNPYFAVADKEGSFTIPNAPPGTWKLKVWNERLKPKYLERTHEVTVTADKETLLEIKP